jgi:CheY-like chemotaxis protein
VSKTILHIESNETDTELVRTLLAARGHEVVHTSSGREAITILGSRQFDLIIVGDQIGDIDGVGMIVKARAINSLVPIIFVSDTWREGPLYQQLTKELQVALVIHRPLRAGLFGAQIESIFASSEKSIRSHIEKGENLVQTLQANYLKVLPARVEKLDGAVKQAHENPDDAASLIEAIRLAHNLKGTAGSCGFGVLGESAGSLEKALNALKESGLSHNQAAWTEIYLIVGLIRNNAQALLGNPVAKVDKRAFATLETPDELSTGLIPATDSALSAPDDNFDSFDDSSSVRVMVYTRDTLPMQRKLGIRHQVFR